MSGPFTPTNILVTGGAGFIASHVVIRLCTLYPHYKVVVLDKLDYCASTKNLASLESKHNFRFIKGDIRSMDLVSYILKTEEIDTVMHFAAQTHVDNSFGNSLAFTLNNTYGTHVLLEAARMAGSIRRFINVSTDEVYGETSLGKTTGLAESSNLDPTNPYSAAKAGAELIARAYITSYKMPIIITRGNNVYGPHQFPEKLIPKFTLLAARGKDLPVHGDGSSVRSYLYVDDVAEAFDCVLHKGVTGETYNIGTESERSVLDVARDIANVFGINRNKVIQVKDRAFNDRRYYIGSSKLAALGWKDSTSWEEGLKKTIDWYMGLKDMETYWVGDLEMALKPHPVAASVPVMA
ncbi:putative rhamnose biosynthetic enzyme 3 [Tetrabaena socialis]|uniref:Putative rhamnose biosynthetic enzyme 3 n=1 Tax=Tetrabaena socialis TaxID=47790 RepID=A0A2J7ZLX5_9CHLO|nr:putative rhamnose biosynthetic enzyme 3 [Tetrabaena socialis]|eukprot:PNH01273.1 putative rhamnose biosynthetic enzyme 3 [Tetrabaena socialis]